jgi:hypothetical protein
MESKEKSLYNLIRKLSHIIKEKQQSSQPSQINMEWTKVALIVPLLEGLGWDKSSDITYKFGPDNNEGQLDLILKCQPPIGIGTNTLCELPPQNIKHPQINKGLRQCKAKGVPYFVWTNGNCWQFFSLSLVKAPIYQVALSEVEVDASVLKKLLIINKDVFASQPERFNKTISEHLKIKSLPHAWATVLQDHTKELLNVFRKGLKHVDIRDEEILQFLKKSRPEYSPPQTKSQIWFSNPGKWEQLVDSHESPYRLARWFFRTSYYRKFGEYLISENYKPWSKDSTWRHAGLPDDTKEKKKVEHAVVLFQEWGFIEDTGDSKYCRVEECVPYLKKILETPTLS